MEVCEKDRKNNPPGHPEWPEFALPARKASSGTTAPERGSSRSTHQNTVSKSKRTKIFQQGKLNHT